MHNTAIRKILTLQTPIYFLSYVKLHHSTCLAEAGSEWIALACKGSRAGEDVPNAIFVTPGGSGQ
jgi:hypothetical protein